MCVHGLLECMASGVSAVYAASQMRWRWRCMHPTDRFCSSGTVPGALRPATTGAACPRLRQQVRSLLSDTHKCTRHPAEVMLASVHRYCGPISKHSAPTQYMHQRIPDRQVLPPDSRQISCW